MTMDAVAGGGTCVGPVEGDPPPSRSRRRGCRPELLLVYSFCALLRILVGIHPHSGQGDHHGAGGGGGSGGGVAIGGGIGDRGGVVGNIGGGENDAVGGGDAKKKYGGDYEAQRHWMEMTLHLPVSEWYHHDLEYWGLDYPPLTAYVSYACGWSAHTLGSLHHRGDGDVCDTNDDRRRGDESVLCSDDDGGGGGGLAILKDMVALRSSRYGHFSEEPGAKLFMRLTVLLLDVLIYFTAVGALAHRLVGGRAGGGGGGVAWVVLFALTQPALILIDHGHFQYNSVSLGLALWSFHFMTLSSPSEFWGPVVGSFLFSLALNFKQMELYHAPAVFAYLLGRCLRPPPPYDDNDDDDDDRNVGEERGDNRSRSGAISSRAPFFRRFSTLGATVVLTFASLWWPFAVYPRKSAGTGLHIDGVLQVLRRLFPFERGVFEGKVSNIWCALSVRPFRVRERLSDVGLLHRLPALATAATLLLILPPCWALFRAGKRRRERTRRRRPNAYNPRPRGRDNNNDNNDSYNNNNKGCDRDRDDLRTLLWGSASASLAFFLASYQVHEKGILIALAPMSLLGLDDGATAAAFVPWFGAAAAWSLWPLLQADRLQDAYVCTTIVYGCAVWSRPWLAGGAGGEGCRTRGGSTGRKESDGGGRRCPDFYRFPSSEVWMPLSLLLAAVLHVSERIVAPPPDLPDLFAVLWSLVGCAMFCLAYATTVWALLGPPRQIPERRERE